MRAPNAIDLYRVGHWCLMRRIPLLPSLFYYLTFFVFNSSIPVTAEIGKGSRCAYGGIGVVIHARAKIGKRVILGQGVTIGGKSHDQTVPEIGDDVYVGAGARILGPIRIGAGSLIAPNAVVVKDVPERSIAAGVPAKVIRSDIAIEEYV
jgi:serine O-acetyltransferase